MSRTITIINPCGTSSIKNSARTHSQKRKKNMATKRKRRRGRPVKRIRRRRNLGIRRKNPRGRKHRITVYRTRKRGKKPGLRRSPYYRIRPRRVNPRGMKGMIGKYFGRGRMMNAVGLLAGMGGSAIAKSFAVRTITNPYQCQSVQAVRYRFRAVFPGGKYIR